MRWILCGKNTAGVGALEVLLGHGDDVFVIGTQGDDGTDGWQRSLVGAATERGVRCETPRRINDPEIVAQLAEFRADALLSIQYDQILRSPLFRKISCRCLNFHFALLPRHRGVSPIAFAVCEGDSEAGVTLHEMVEAIDSGDVFAQRSVPIGPADTARGVYDRVSEAAISLFQDTYPFGADQLGPGWAQSGNEASYHRQGDFDFASRGVDWSRPAEALHRWLRAMIFPPFQFPETSFRGQTLSIEVIAGEVGPAVAAEPGSIVASSDAGIDVAAADGTIRVVTLSGSGIGSDAPVQSIPVGSRFIGPGAEPEPGGST